MDSRSSENLFSFEQDDLLIKSMPILQELRKNGLFCDVVVKAGGRDFPAHRPVLAATIPYFYTMLTSEYVESNQREICIKDVDASALKALIDFSYSGTIKIDPQKVQILMRTADFVGLEQVKYACANYLKSNIQADTVLEIKKLANLLNCHQLVSAAVKFIKENFPEISKSNEFLISKFEEFKELIRKNGKSCSEEKVFEAAMQWVKHNESERNFFLPEILSIVRLSQVSTDFLVNIVSNEKSIASSFECLRIVDKAKDYQLMQWQNNFMQTSQRLTKFNNIVTLKRDTRLEFYDIMKNEWLNEGPLNLNGVGAAVVLLGSKINIIDVNGSLDIYDLETKYCSNGKNMIDARRFSGATTLNDCIYACGGITGTDNRLSSVECYSAKKNCWKEVAPMIMKRSSHGVTSLNGYIYAIGGFNKEQDILNFCEKYDPSSNLWINIKPLLCRRFGPGIATLNNKIYVCGGSNGNCDGGSDLNSCEVYDPSTDTWSFISSMNEKRLRPSLASYEGKLYAVGGNSSSKSSVEVYFPETDSWKMLD